MSRIEREGAHSRRSLIGREQSKQVRGVALTLRRAGIRFRRWRVSGRSEAPILGTWRPQKTQTDITELDSLAFDQRLNAAATGEGLTHNARL